MSRPGKEKVKKKKNYTRNMISENLHNEWHIGEFDPPLKTGGSQL